MATKIETPQYAKDAFAEFDKNKIENELKLANAGTPTQVSDVDEYNLLKKDALERAKKTPEELKAFNEETLRGGSPDPTGIVTTGVQNISTGADGVIDIGKVGKTVPKTTGTEGEGMPETPEFTPTDVPKPTTTFEDVSRRDIRRAERDVRKEYAPIFDQLENIEELAAQGKTDQIDLYTKNANDIIALLSEQEQKLIELKTNKDLTAGELAEVERQREEVAREKLLAENALAKAETASQYKDNIALQEQYNENQRVRLETFAGLRNGFGSSALVTNLENVMNEGQRALNSLRTSATQADARYANEAMNIEKEYNLALSSINTNLNAQLMSNYNDLETATMQISQNKLLTTQERDEKIQQAITDYNDKVAENQLRTVSLMQQQNADVQNRIATLKEDNYRNYQIKRDEELTDYQLRTDEIKYGNELAQENFMNQLSLYSTVSNILAQEAGNDIQYKQLQQQLKFHEDEMALAKNQFEEMKRQFGSEQALKWYNAQVAEQQTAEQIAIEDYKAKNNADINKANLGLSKRELELRADELLFGSYIKMTDAEGNDYLYDPINNDVLLQEEREAMQEEYADWYYFDQAFNSVLGFETEQTRNTILNTAKNYFVNGDDKSTRQELEKAIIKTGGDSGDALSKANLIIPILSTLKKDLQNYYQTGGFQETVLKGFQDIDLTPEELMELEKADKGTGTGRWTSVKEKFYNSVFNETTDANLAELATKIASSIAAFTVSLSGAQFSDAERKEYTKQFPSIWKSEELNTANINGLLSTWSSMKEGAITDALPETTYNAIWGNVVPDGATMQDILYNY